MDKFTIAYIECALWSSTDNSGNSLDQLYEINDLAPDTLKTMTEDCVDFQQTNDELLVGVDVEQAGHDFWLTRNRHGAGFWDRNLGKIGDQLTRMAHSYGEQYLYIGDDWKLYIQ